MSNECPKTAGRGICPTFGCEVIPSHCAHCQARDKYYVALTQGWQPYGAEAKVSAPGKAPNLTLVGNQLHYLIKARYSHDPLAGCSCKSWIRRMNKWGPEGCLENMPAIVKALLEQAEKRKIKQFGLPAWKLPFASLGIRRLVLSAIREANRQRRD